MGEEQELFSRNVTIVNELGLHARSAAKIAEITLKAESDVWILREGDKVDAKSVIDMLTLACIKGSNITIKVDSRSDTNILDNIVKLIEDGFGE